MVLERFIAWVKGRYRIFMIQFLLRKPTMLALIANITGPCLCWNVVGYFYQKQKMSEVSRFIFIAGSFLWIQW